MANLILRGPYPRWAEGRREWDPFRELLQWDPFAEMLPRETSEMTFTPRFEVRETKDAYVFKADLPGIAEDSLDISFTGNRLTVSGHREAEEREEGETYYAYERSYGTFTRSFTLPEGVDADKVQADLQSGVLTISVPKSPELQPKKISVKGIGKGLGDKVKGMLGKEKDKPQAS